MRNVSFSIQELTKKYLIEHHLGLIVLVFFFPIILYINTIPNDYNMDDELVTINHRNTSRGLSAISDIFSQYYYEDEMGYKYEYRPIAHLSFALEHEFLGESPHISHLINCLLYALVCLLLYRFLLSFFPQKMALLAFMATLIFVFHPIHTEVVASIKNRDELLAFGFVLAAFMLINKSINRLNGLIVFIPVLFVLGIYSKMSIIGFIVMFPILMLFFKKTPFLQYFIAVSSILLSVFLADFWLKNEKVILLILLFGGYVILYSVFYKKPFFIWEFIERKVFIYFKNPRLIFHIIRINFSLSKWYIMQPALILPFRCNHKKIFFFNVAILLVFFINYFTQFNLFVSGFSYLLPVWFLIGFFLVDNQIKLTIQSISFIASLYFLQINYEVYLLVILFFNSILIVNYNELKKVLPIVFCMLFIPPLVIKKIEFIDFLNFISTIIILIIGFRFNYPIKKGVYFLLTYMLLIASIHFISNLDLVYIVILLLWTIILSLVLFLKKSFNLLITFQIFSIIFFVFYSNNFPHYLFPEKENSSKVEVLNNESLPHKQITSLYEVKYGITPAYNLETAARPLHFIETPVNVHELMSMRLATGMYVFGKYLQKTIVPYPMGFYYGYAYITPKTFNDAMPWVMLGVFIFLGLLTLYWIVIKQYVLAFGLIIYLAGTFQALGIYVPIPGAMGDRFLFIPSIGFSLLLAYPFYKAIGTKWQRPALAILAIILVAYGFLTIQRNFQWKDRITLFEADIEYLDKSAQAHALLADAYMRKATSENVSEQEYLSLAEKAIYRYQKAIAIYPDFLNFHFFKGKIHESLGQFEPAIASYKKAISLEKDFSYEPYLSIGSMYFEMQNYQESAYYLEQTVVMGFKAEYIYNSIFLCYANMGLFEKALNTIDEGLKVYPNNYDMNLNKAKLLLNSGNIEQALIYFKIADRINPGNPEIKAILQEFDSL